jgi:hypothetical protein
MEGTVGLQYLGPDGQWYAVSSLVTGNGGLPVVVIGSVGPGNTVNISEIGGIAVISAGIPGALAVGGTSAAGAADDGSNPLKIGGVFTAAPPVLASGQRGNLQLTSRGALTNSVTDPTSGAAAAVPAAGVDASSNAAAGLQSYTRPSLFNGVTWDRQRSAGVAGAAAVGGTSAAGVADDASNPLKVGGVFSAVLPTLASGQRGALQLTAKGAATSSITDPTSGAGATVAAGALAVGGTAAAGAPIDASNPVKVAGTDGVNNRTLLTDTLGNTFTRPSKAATYCAAFVGTTTGAGVLVQLKGSATKTVRVSRVTMAGYFASAASVVILELKRDTAAATAGTPVVATITPSDSANPAATAVATNFTTAGTENGAVGVSYAFQPFWNTVTVGPGTVLDIVLGGSNSRVQEMVLHGVNEYFSLVTVGALPAATNVTFTIEWTEE